MVVRAATESRSWGGLEKYDVRVNKIVCLSDIEIYKKDTDWYDENSSVAILPEVDFSLGSPSKDIEEQLN